MYSRNSIRLNVISELINRSDFHNIPTTSFISARIIYLNILQYEEISVIVPVVPVPWVLVSVSRVKIVSASLHGERAEVPRPARRIQQRV